MLHWKEFSAWVTIDGKEVVEYDVETSEDEKTVTCWIASELGKVSLCQVFVQELLRYSSLSTPLRASCHVQKFSICCSNYSFPLDVGGFVKVDGNTCGGTISYHHKDLGRTFAKTGVTDGTIIRPFVFSSLELTGEFLPNIFVFEK